jgi:hypothetical protein
MKIKVTTERDCCHPDDLQNYRGSNGLPHVLNPKFCKYCGQLWYLSTYTDAAGDTDTEYVRYMPELDRRKN